MGHAFHLAAGSSCHVPFKRCSTSTSLCWALQAALTCVADLISTSHVLCADVTLLGHLAILRLHLVLGVMGLPCFEMACHRFVTLSW